MREKSEEINLLFSEWIVGLLKKYFSDQKRNGSDKLFIKVAGIDDSMIADVLRAARLSFDELGNYYAPILRTLKPVNQFNEFKCREYETSTWLRNNTEVGSALIIIMNDSSPEAQSLENIFTINEARIMSIEGLDILYSILVEKFDVFAEELDILKSFIKMLMKVTDPQLRSLLSFIASIISSTEDSMVQKIQTNLKELYLFNDPKLTIKMKDGLPKLKSNYNLSHLQSDSGKILNKEDLINRLYNFIDSEEKNGYESELWNQISSDYVDKAEKFRTDALNFLNNESLQLLEYDFNLINNIFSFKTKKPTVPQKINDFIEGLGITLDHKQDKLLTQTLETVLSNDNNVDSIQEFIEEFKDELIAEPKLHKQLERIAEKKRHSNVYDELSEALLYEGFSLLEEAREDRQLEDIQLVLSIEDKHLNEKMLSAINIHFVNIHKKLSIYRFEERSIPTVSEKEKDDDINIRIDLTINGEIVSSRKFKLSNIFASSSNTMVDHLIDYGHIPYIQQYVGDQPLTINVIEETKKQVQGYIETGSEEMKDSFEVFSDLINDYTGMIKDCLNEGIYTIDTKILEDRLERLLIGIYQPTLYSKNIYQYITLIGTVDYFNCKIDEVGSISKRTLTMFNPIRLLSYLKRFERIEKELLKWKDLLNAENLSIGELNDYVQQINTDISKLSPRYFVIDGESGKYLVEHQEKMGEGDFTHTSKFNDTLKSVNTFAEELLSTVKNYIEVYPYAKDSIDLVFLYCNDSEFVTKSLELIRQKTSIKRIKAVVHSLNKGAYLYDTFNAWMHQNGEIVGEFTDFPLVDIQVISENEINKISNRLAEVARNTDIGVLVDYFGQANNINFKLERVQINRTDEWFSGILMEPLKKDEAVKRISYVSEHLPKVMQYFYQMQYILETNQMINEDECYLLRNIISITSKSDNHLINFMHDNFNWSLFIDRYLDKSLLKKVSSKAQIIKYKNSSFNKDYKTIVSSSNYIKKITESTLDYEYYDRLYQKYKLLLRNDRIDRKIIIRAVERVKEISGGIILKAIGPGKFAHEMISIYLATELRPKIENELLIWSVCDELPWFHRSKRRPDLVATRIKKVDDEIHLHFEIVELKFISHTIFEIERVDAIDQIKAGVDLYNSLFNFKKTNSEIYRKELVSYLIELSTYSVSEAELLKDLQNISLEKIKVEISSSIDTYVYTSNLHEIYQFSEKNVNGKLSDVLYNQYTNNVYNRSFILDLLGASTDTEDEVPNFEDELTLNRYVAELEDDTETSEEKFEYKAKNMIEKAPEEQSQKSTEDLSRLPITQGINEYPEEIALLNVERTYNDNIQDFRPLLESYRRELIKNFNQMGITLKVVDSIVGVSVIRLILEGSSGIYYKKVKSSEADMALWLKLSDIPHISIRHGRINIDINRENPEIVYFEKFMELVRREFSTKELRGKLIAPLGVGQLNEVISMDLSSPDTPHLLIGGRTGSGKSVTVNSIILSLMCLYSPSEVQFIFIDPKKVEFLVYENRHHTQQVVTEIKDAILLLEQMIDVMEERYRLFAQESVTSIDQYIEVTNQSIPHLVIVFDEFADFMSQEKQFSSKVENTIQRLGAKARAAGIHLLICTQSPKADIVPTNIRNNLPARLALRATDHHASKIILDEEGAETLGGKGEFLAKLDSPNIQRGKSPFLTVNVKRALLKHFEKVQPVREEELLK
ncbi:FtsK/SpoIIIE domain-containing protein [Paenibacillus urinalis]|uniref:FtsK/SpoIIIE domain-containing protein n=1 Tax=Paenibacillus urinalis TaxID=521520 RepID=UPI001961612B